jgi:hypothetical protein
MKILVTALICKRLSVIPYCMDSSRPGWIIANDVEPEVLGVPDSRAPLGCKEEAFSPAPTCLVRFMLLDIREFVQNTKMGSCQYIITYPF